MANRNSPLWAVIFALIVSGCSETGGFEAPLITSGVLTPEEANASAKEQSEEPAPGAGPVSVNDDPYNIDTDYISYRNTTYRIRDLNPGERPALDTDEAGFWMQSDRLEQRIKTSCFAIRQ